MSEDKTPSRTCTLTTRRRRAKPQESGMGPQNAGTNATCGIS